MSARLEEAKLRYENQLRKAIGHLEYSMKKIVLLPTNPAELDDESLETWESFSSRFSRVVDLYLTKYVRCMVLLDDPGFRGTVRDFANQGEKMGIVNDAALWMQARELRNIEAHSYSDELQVFLDKLRNQAPLLLRLKDEI